MRLIDADKLIEELKNLAKGQISSCPNIAEFFVSIRVDRIIDILNSQPTAFDVEKVVSELEEQISKHDLLFNKYVKDKDKSCSWSISELNKIRGLLEAIDIVKAGEIDE